MKRQAKALIPKTEPTNTYLILDGDTVIRRERRAMDAISFLIGYRAAGKQASLCSLMIGGMR